MKNPRRLWPLLLVAAVLLAMPASAQVLEWGLKAGMNRASWGGGGVVASDTRTGIAAGGFASVYFHPMFALQTEVLYSMRGSQYQGQGERLTVEQDYVEIPLLAKMSIPLQGGGSLRPSVYAGPIFGLELSCDAVIRQDPDTRTEACDGPTLELQTTSGDVGLLFGLEARFALAGRNVGVEARYNVGLTSIDDREAFQAEIQNRVFSLLASYAF